MTNALILAMLWMLMYASNVEYPKLFVFMWCLAVFINSFGSKKWR